MGGIFVDTVWLISELYIDDTQLHLWRSQDSDNNGTCFVPKTYTNRIFNNLDTPINFIYHPPNQRYSKPAFITYFSIPRILYGDNSVFGNFDEIYEVIPILNNIANGVSWKPDVDYGGCILNRIDPVAHYQVDNPSDYIRSIVKLDNPHRHPTRVYEKDSVYFISNTVTGKFYKKSLLDPPYFTLRHELSLRPTHTIENKMDMQNPVLADVTLNWVRKELQKELDAYHLSSTILCDKPLASEMLNRTYGVRKGNRLLGFLFNFQTMTDEELIEEDMCQSTIYNYKRDIIRAGVSLALSAGNKPLMPILLPDL